MVYSAGLQAENSAEQAGKNAQLMIELVDAHVKLAREKAATGISKLTYNSESGFDPLGANYTTKLTSIIYMLGSAIHLCDTLKKQKELTKIMLSR